MGERRADVVAGLSIAGLLLPEAVAYSQLADLPPQAGVLALFVGLLAYAVLGQSRFAIVSATSSSAAVLLSATRSFGDAIDPGTRMALAAGLVLLAGGFLVLASMARLGSLSSLIAKPVLRGFALGLALTIVLKQLPAILAVHPLHDDFFRLAVDLCASWRQWNGMSAALGLGALVLLKLLGRFPVVPGALMVIVLGIGLDVAGFGERHGVPVVGPIDLSFGSLSLPSLGREDWLRLGELACALALIVYAESWGSIRAFALQHGDAVDANRELRAIGVANMLSGLVRGMPVGAGYSATSANEAAGAQSRLAGVVACVVVGAAVSFLLPWVAHTPGPVLAAIVIHAVGHTLSLRPIEPYFRWRRDRFLVVLAFAAVLLLGVLDGLLAAIAGSLALLLRSLAGSRVSWLGRLNLGHDFVDVGRHPDAVVPDGVLIARPEEPLFFGNADVIFESLRQRVLATSGVRVVVLSLEQSFDLDATSIEALCDFATWLAARDQELLLARVKDSLRHLLSRVDSPALPAPSYAAWSVDDAVTAAMAKV